MWKQRVDAHVAIARFDHSIKNIFVVPGILVPISLQHFYPSNLLRNIALGFLATTLIACSNYVINEVLDAASDRLHPIKKSRPAACGLVNIPLAYVQWILMMLTGMAVALQVSRPFAYAAGVLWIMGCLYNIRPFRTKDIVFLDVLTESVNNPLRMLLGWFMVTTTLIPPLSLLCCYWMFGCYLMGLKRFSELREIGNAQTAGYYRKSFRHYTELSLLQSVFFYASFSMLLFGAFIIRYRIELILAFPLIAWMMCTYFSMAFKAQSAVQNPEKLYKEPRLMAQLAVITTTSVMLLYINIPRLGEMFMSSSCAAITR